MASSSPKELPPKPEAEPESVKEEKRQIVRQSQAISQYCKKVSDSFKRWSWKENHHCSELDWHHVRNSINGDPLFWKVFGDESKNKNGELNTTMILCGVHGDEITPIKFCFDIIDDLHNNHLDFDGKLVVVAPIVNPDSFFRPKPTRTNARKVDINRNFPTENWHNDAIRMWKRRYRANARRNPGTRPLSEPEVLFQVNLIKRYKPDKIISVHAPLTMLDYDGPALSPIGHRAAQLLKKMSANASNYRIKNYNTFPGSLGRWAGMERHIPTYTLELPSSDARKSKEYWDLFRPSIHQAIGHHLKSTE